MEEVNLEVGSVSEAAAYLKRRFAACRVNDMFVLYLSCGSQNHRYSIRYETAPDGGIVTVDPEGCVKASCRLASAAFDSEIAETLQAGLDAHY